MDYFFIWHSSLPSNLGNLSTGRPCKTLIKFTIADSGIQCFPSYSWAWIGSWLRYKVNCMCVCDSKWAANLSCRSQQFSHSLPKMWNPWERDIGLKVLLLIRLLHLYLNCEVACSIKMWGAASEKKKTLVLLREWTIRDSWRLRVVKDHLSFTLLSQRSKGVMGWWATGGGGRAERERCLNE